MITSQPDIVAVLLLAFRMAGTRHWVDAIAGTGSEARVFLETISCVLSMQAAVG